MRDLKECPAHGTNYYTKYCSGCEWAKRVAELEAERAKLQKMFSDQRDWLIAGDKRYERLREAWRQLLPYLHEVLASHKEPEDPCYNECETPDTECAWCADVKQIIDSVEQEAGMGAKTMTMAEANEIAQRRIAELEAKLAALTADPEELAGRNNDLEDHIEELQAENQRLRGLCAMYDVPEELVMGEQEVGDEQGSA